MLPATPGIPQNRKTRNLFTNFKKFGKNSLDATFTKSKTQHLTIPNIGRFEKKLRVLRFCGIFEE